MESTGSFGDLLAAFNIDSEDSDIAIATHQYDEANPNDTNEDAQDGTIDQQQAGGVNKDDQIIADDQSKISKDSQQIDSVKVVSTPTSVVSESTLSTDITPVSIGNFVSIPNLVPQVNTIVPPVYAPVSQLPTDAVLLPTLAQNSIPINQTVLTPTQLQQPLVQSIQGTNGLLTNPIPINGQSFSLINPSAGLVDMNAGAAAAVLPQGVLQGVAPQATPPATIVNLGGITSNLLTVPMSLVPPVPNQSNVVTHSTNVTPNTVISPSAAPETHKFTMTSVKQNLDDSTQFTHKFRKKRPVGATPTVQELLEQKRSKKIRVLAPRPPLYTHVTQSSSILPLQKPLKIPLQNTMVKLPGIPLEKRVEPQIELSRSKTSGRRIRPTKRYVEFMTSNHESEDDFEELQSAAVKPKSPAIDLNKPLTDQLMTIAETSVKPTGLTISNVQSLAGTSAQNCGFSSVENSVKIKSESMDTYEGDKSDDGSNDKDDESEEEGVVLPDGMKIKKEPQEQSQQTKRKHNSENDPLRVSKQKTGIGGSKDNMTEACTGESDTSKPLDFRKPIKTREEEEKIASEAATRAATQALLRVAAQGKDEDTIAKSKEDSLKKAMLEEQKKKEEAAIQKIREEAQKIASEAAARAASLAMARSVTMDTDSDIDQKSQEDAAEASRIASEAAARAAAEAAKRAATAQVLNAPADLHLAEKIQIEAELAKMIASEAAARAAAQALSRAVIQHQAASRVVIQNDCPVDLSISSRVNMPVIKQEPDNAIQQVALSQIAQEAAARAVLAAQSRIQNFVPILPLPPSPQTCYTKPTHISQMLQKADIPKLPQAGFTKPHINQIVHTPDLLVNQPVAIEPKSCEWVEPLIQETKEVNKVVTPRRQIITYPKNPSKNLRESLAWKSFQEGVKQGKYRVVQKSVEVVNANGRHRNAANSCSANIVNQEMRCPYCLIQMKVKSNLTEHIKVCLINPETCDEIYLQSHSATDDSIVRPPVFVCPHCTPNAASVKELKSWSNVLCRQCVTKCADPKIVENTEDHYVVTKSGYYVCKHCGIGLDCEMDMNKHHSQDVKKTSGIILESSEEPVQKAKDKTSLPVSKILPAKKEPDPAFQFRCGQCRLMFASVGLLLVHTSHCNLNQYIKVLERLSFYNCVSCPVACKVVLDISKPHKCSKSTKTPGKGKTLQAVRDISVSKESYVCLRCEEILPSNGHLTLHTKHCNHAQYHLLMRYLDQPPSCNKCLMVFTGYREYAQHPHKCSNIRQNIEEFAECPLLSFCLKCDKAVQREDVDQMYHNAVCIGLPCTQQKLLFPDGFNIRECCTIINSW